MNPADKIRKIPDVPAIDRETLGPGIKSKTQNELHPEAIPIAEEFMDTCGDSGYYASIEQIRNILNQIDQENAIPETN